MAALFSFLNHRFLGLPTTIGVTLLVLVASLALTAASTFGLPARDLAIEVIKRLDFRDLVMNGMLSFLLFAGSLKLAVDFKELVGTAAIPLTYDRLDYVHRRLRLLCSIPFNSQ